MVVPLNTRFIFETWGAIHFARTTLSRLIEEGDIAREEKFTNRLTFGARSQVMLPYGGMVEERSISVMEFIRCLKDIREDAEDLYNFLSEASHPNLFQNLYFQMAGPPISNWDNAGFREHVHGLLERTLTALEAATGGMETDVVTILGKGTDYINGHG